ncbi:MAG: peptidase M16 [Flammeovirgaceae bacterium]|jgi:predicted Zn-dependent peptidase|nr:peptidase M16 [Flammeovirgaceae bacterium]|tara:strand:- start:131 stop:1432 length:1302 start_codon:yes stop_codon:yes gene_type:complete
MKKLLIFILFIPFVTYTQNIEFVEYDLDNGLHVILHKDNSAPVVTTQLMFHVGSKDEDPERTGFAHFFEHMLGEETKNMAKGEWYKILSANGGEGNAGTSLDYTYYYATMPSNSLRLGIWRYSEILFHPILNEEEIRIQRGAIKEEKRLRDNQPYSRFLEYIQKHLFKAHPYKEPIIGSIEHLNAAEYEDFIDFNAKFYTTRNAVFTVAGDIDIEETKEMVSYYFSEIPDNPKPEKIFPRESDIISETRVKEYDPNIQIPAIFLNYRTPPMKSREARVLDLISTYLSTGKSSRLYKKLVDEKKIALEVQAVSLPLEEYGIYAIFALPLGETTLDRLKSEIDEEIISLKSELISEKDYQKLQNIYENNFVNSNASIEGVATSLSQYHLFYDDTNLINSSIDIYQSITREEIRDVAVKYLNDNQRVVMDYLPENK